MSRYKSLTVEAVVEYADGVEDTTDHSFTAEHSEEVMPHDLAVCLHANVQRIDHLSDHGEWVHGAVGA